MSIKTLGPFSAQSRRYTTTAPGEFLARSPQAAAVEPWQGVRPQQRCRLGLRELGPGRSQRRGLNWGRSGSPTGRLYKPPIKNHEKKSCSIMNIPGKKRRASTQVSVCQISVSHADCSYSAIDVALKAPASFRKRGVAHPKPRSKAKNTRNAP